MFKVNLNSFKKISTILFSVAIASLVNPNLLMAQEKLNEVEIKTIPVRENVYMLVGEGGNIGVAVGEDGVFLIDDQFAPLTDKIRAAIAQITDQPIRFLINTHYHFDHTGGNENLGKLGVVIVAHDNVPKQMSVSHIYEVLGMERPAAPETALPVITFNDTTTFHLNGGKIKAFHVPLAHTDGDTIIHFQTANIIHTGDIFFNGVYPFIDIDSGGSIDGILSAINRILPLCDDQTLIIPGHGGLSNRKELIEYRNMLETVKHRTQKAIAQGITLENFIKSQPLADFDDTWGKGFLNSEQFLTIAYKDQKN